MPLSEPCAQGCWVGVSCSIDLVDWIRGGSRFSGLDSELQVLRPKSPIPLNQQNCAFFTGPDAFWK